jgi:hypothetical protein
MLQFLFCAKCLFSGICATSLGKIYTIIDKLITGYKLLIGFSYNSLLQFDISLLILLESSQFYGQTRFVTWNFFSDLQY